MPFCSPEVDESWQQRHNDDDQDNEEEIVVEDSGWDEPAKQIAR